MPAARIKPPYYYKTRGSDTYHWYRRCHKNNYPDEGWTKSERKPSNREQCDQCQSLRKSEIAFQKSLKSTLKKLGT